MINIIVEFDGKYFPQILFLFSPFLFLLYFFNSPKCLSIVQRVSRQLVKNLAFIGKRVPIPQITAPDCCNKGLYFLQSSIPVCKILPCSALCKALFVIED